MTPTSVIQSFHNVVRPNRSRRVNEILCLILSDWAALLVSVVLSVVCKKIVTRTLSWQDYIQYWPFLFVFIAVYAAAGLYSGVALNPIEELRRATVSSSTVFLVLGAATMSRRLSHDYFTWTLLSAMILSVVLVPVFRSAVRSFLARQGWWGRPAVVFGAGPEGRKVVETLIGQPELGLKPVAIVDEEGDAPPFYSGVPVMSSVELDASVSESCKFSYAVVAMPGEPSSGFLSLIERHRLHFSHILMIPHAMDFASLGVNPKSVGEMLGLEVCQQALIPQRQWTKRLLDLTLTIVGGLCILPLIALIALWIKADSPGPVFYGHQRIGQGGIEFRAWKFRSMAPNADQVLHRYLEEHPHLREEWERDRKLRGDPRTTRVGRFLRRTSLDELPQLWNVLKGEMSLVGPRPIVRDEIAKYGDQFPVYSVVRGGLTGLWQISGRNDTSYGERVKFDVFYVRNWSVWLDLYILFRTIETVLLRKGAY
jgi:Undecaprenyl-phosphate galactose phosphotransferase WbaP